ncbi:MAG: outer membrane beta-barrel protein [Pseudomonadota bacterium]
MRKLILGAVAALAICAVPAVASAQGGYVDLGYAYSDSDAQDNHVDTWTVGGATAFDLGGLGAQVDGRYNNASSEGVSNDLNVWSVGGHLYKRDSSFLIGGYVGYNNYDTGVDDNLDEWTVAGETQFYMPQSTVSASLSYSDVKDAFVTDDFKVWSIDGDYKYFLNDNWSLHGGLGYGQGDAGDAGDSIDIWQAGVGTEYQLASVPVSFFANYRHSSLSGSGAVDDVDADSLSVGVRYNFGGSLMDRDRSGAGLSTPAGAFQRLIGVFTS